MAWVEVVEGRSNSGVHYPISRMGADMDTCKQQETLLKEI